MDYIQYMKPGGTAENKKETSKFIGWLNKAGKSWKDFWDKPVTIQYAYNPHAVVGNGGTPFSTTQRCGDFAKLTAAAVAIPATATGVATVGVVPTLVGMVAGMGAGIAADVGGSKLVELAGGDENALEMVGDMAGFIAGILAGGGSNKVIRNIPSPALVRRMPVPSVDSKGFVLLIKPENAVGNFTIGKTFLPHKHYKARTIGSTPAVVIEGPVGWKPLSIKPMDTFFHNNRINTSIKPSQITVISGNPQDLALAKSLGYKTLTSPKLLAEFANSTHAPKDGLSIVKEGLNNPLNYKNLLDELIARHFPTRWYHYLGLKARNPHLKLGMNMKSTLANGKLSFEPTPADEYLFFKSLGFESGHLLSPEAWNLVKQYIDAHSMGVYKSGGSIKIKKKNIGSFTRYCNGKVTEECIRKGKNSSNPTTRKRANFAANARKWKHEEGGKLNYLNYFQHE